MTDLAALKSRGHAIARDDDILEAAVQLADRVTTAANARCADTTPLDRAIVAIAERHGLDQS
jgi:hypothetical protein